MFRPTNSAVRVAAAAFALATWTALLPASEAATATASRSLDEPGGSRLVLDEGHIDLFEVSYAAESGEFDLNIKDDTRIYTGPDDPAVLREPEDVVISLATERARIEVTEDFPQGYQDLIGPPGTAIYYTDEIQTDGLPWPGWSSERLPAQLDAAGIMLENGTYPAYQNVQTLDLDLDITGPGDVYTWMNGTEDPIALFVDTRTPEPDTIPVPVGSHVHSSWGFTEPGTYVMNVTPSANKIGGGTVTGDTRTYRFVVGGPDVTATRAPRLTQAAAAVRVGTRLTIARGAYDPADPLLDTEWVVDGETVGYEDTFLVPARLFSQRSTSVGRRIHAVVTARREGFTTTEATTADYPIRPGLAPRPVQRPRIIGRAQVGRTLRATSGTWSPKPDAYRYQWQIGGRNIVKARTSRLEVMPRWRGKRIAVRVVVLRDGHDQGIFRVPATKRVAPQRG